MRVEVGALAISMLATVLVASAAAEDGFVDVPPGHVFETDIDWLADQGVTRGCNPPSNDRFCPDAAVTRGQMAAFLVRALDLTETKPDLTFSDTGESVFEVDIMKLASAGITRGCNPPTNDRFCPEQTVTRAQMAAFLVRALDLTKVDPGITFVDISVSIFASDIVKLATAGVTSGCNPPTNDRYCPDTELTRGQMAAFLHRAITGVPQLSGRALPDGTRGDHYSQTLRVTGGTAPYTWTAQGTPAELALDDGGVLTGTPTTTGLFAVDVTVTDSRGRTAAAVFTIEIDEPLQIVTTALPKGTQGEPYDFAVTATGGEMPYTWTAAVLPDGLVMEPVGSLSGSPSLAGPFDVGISVADSDGRTADTVLGIEILGPVRILSTSLVDGTVGESYIDILEGVAGEPPYTWEASGLPAGLSVVADGTITGNPQGSGSFVVAVSVTDNTGGFADATVPLEVYEPLAIVHSGLPDAVVGEAYHETLSITGGKPPYQWAAAAPAGIDVDSNGTLAGVPTTAGEYDFDVTVVDAGGRSDATWFYIDVDDPLNISNVTLPDARVSVPYATAFQAEGGEPPYWWSFIYQPRGLQVWSDGTMTGTPESPRLHDVHVSVRDDDGRTLDRIIEMFVAGVDRVSESWYGSGPGNADSHAAAISGEGRWIAYSTDASNIDVGDTDGVADIYVYDTHLLKPYRVSLAWDEAELDRPATQFDVNDDGDSIAFASDAPDVLPGMEDGVSRIFLRQRSASHTFPVSVGPSGMRSNGDSRDPRISGDGRYVTFLSEATNLVLDDTNGLEDLFVHDHDDYVTWRINLSSDGEQADGRCVGIPEISGDGRWVVFASDADNMVDGDSNGHTDVFLHDLETGTTVRISQTPSGAVANGGSFNPTVSRDGSFVVFTSDATDLVTGDTNSVSDVFLYDRSADTIERISFKHDGAQFDGATPGPAYVSENGRFVAFSTDTDGVVPGDVDGESDVFVLDRQLGTISRMSEGPDGTNGVGGSNVAGISDDGAIVIFVSTSGALVEDDDTGFQDVFIAAVDTRL